MNTPCHGRNGRCAASYGYWQLCKAWPLRALPFPHSGYVPVTAEAEQAYHPHSGYVPVTAEAEQAYQVEHYPLCGPSPLHSERIAGTVR